MATRESRENVSMPMLQVKYIKCTERIPGTIVAVLGLLTSLWANCVLVVVSIQDNNYSFQRDQNYISKQIILTSQLTHLVITITVTAGLFLGLKEKNRSLLPPWIAVKLIEIVSLFVGIILLTVGRQFYIGLLPLAVIFLMVGGYISLSVWDTYGKMATATNASVHDVNLDIDEELSLPKDPPSYDFVNHNVRRS